MLALALFAQLSLSSPAPAPLVGAPVVVDGDTFDAGATRFRLADVDAPEVTGGCPASRALAALATRRLAQLLAGGPVAVTVVGRQPATARYRERLVARVTAGGVDVGAALIAEGYARPNGERPGWCAGGR